MANPLRIVANMPKNPLVLVSSFTNWMDAEKAAEDLRVEGKFAKVTRLRLGSPRGKRPLVVFRVWTR